MPRHRGLRGARSEGAAGAEAGAGVAVYRGGGGKKKKAEKKRRGGGEFGKGRFVVCFLFCFNN